MNNYSNNPKQPGQVYHLVSKAFPEAVDSGAVPRMVLATAEIGTIESLRKVQDDARTSKLVEKLQL